MYEVILAGALWITVLFGIIFNFLTWREVTKTIENNAAKLPDLNMDIVVEKIGDEIDAIITDVMGNFNMPTAQDHLFGMISQFVQSKMMRDLHKDGLLNPNIDPDHSTEHGEA